MRSTRSKPPASFFDRLALAFLNALIALPTGTLLWLALNGFPFTWVGWLPAQSILWFTLIMAMAGAVIESQLLADCYGHLWQLVVRVFLQK
ncbi:MAG: hypothetical protein L0H70_03805 [Xanthomonadales bacterium]|nr:hypothetical protein [Xanthomonadales bacterium]